MAIKIQNTRDYGFSGVKALVFGVAGIGKTTLCSTAPNPIIISAEAGLLSLARQDLPFIEVHNLDDVDEAYKYLTESEQGQKFKTICVDSITEIAEVMLAEYKIELKDPRAAYGKLADDMGALIRLFRDIKDRHVMFTAKQTRIEDDDSGATLYKPLMPGRQLLNNIDYFFDMVFAMRIGRLEDGTRYRYIQTGPSVNYSAKDRSGQLPFKIMANLTDIFKWIVEGRPEELEALPVKGISDETAVEEELKQEKEETDGIATKES